MEALDPYQKDLRWVQGFQRSVVVKILHSMITIVLLVNTPIYVIVEVRSYIPKYKQSAIARFILVSLTPISLGSDNSLEKTIPIKCLV